MIDQTKSYYISRNLFLRFLAAIYFIAFASLSVQILGLIGSDGILPVQEFLIKAEKYFGFKNFLQLPTVFWFDASNQTLIWVCQLGMGFAVLAFLGICPALCFFILWILYLSIVHVGQDFLSFQWDVLLLEAGFLSIFLSPWTLFLDKTKEAPSRWMVFLCHVLLFKLMLESGMVKILSGDETWKNFTALTFHYWTQPIPNPISWYAQQLPDWFQTFSCGVMFIIELIIPFGIFLFWSVRRVTCGILILFQMLIILTGNYCFFNLLTIVLCILLIDDDFFEDTPLEKLLGKDPQPLKRWKRNYVRLVAFFMISLTILNFTRMYIPPHKVTPMLKFIMQSINPFMVNNNYGLFAAMTTSRPEIIIEGSMDGNKWEEYEFKYKPGNLKRYPPQVAPHQPRLDWQMWFAALRPDIRQSPWVISLLQRLAEGSKPVMGLLASDPFNGAKPKFIRTKVYDYEFTTFKEHQETQDWWKRTYKGLYSPVFSLQ